jgi:hypothetical protein
VPSNQEVRDPEAADFRPEGGRDSAECRCVSLIDQGSEHRSEFALQAATAGSMPAWAP